MTSLKIATAAMFFALAACVPTKTPLTAPDMMDYPLIAQNAVADGQVFEYH